MRNNYAIISLFHVVMKRKVKNGDDGRDYFFLTFNKGTNTRNQTNMWIESS